jgi:1-acyl-sn-glycerol-3-phosphate acyltransferase
VEHRTPRGLPPYRWATARHRLTVLVVRTLPRLYVRLRVEGLERRPAGAGVYCFNHLNWVDPIVLLGALPSDPHVSFFGPKEEDMMVGGRNRLMRWAGIAVPYRPGDRGLIDATRRVEAILGSGGILAVAGEGRIHVGERVVPPLNDGAAFFAIRAGVPIVPVAISGTSWLAFGRRVRIRMGDPIDPLPFHGRAGIADLTELVRHRLEELVADAPERRAPGPIGRRLTELFNDWAEGHRPPDPEPTQS